jgi:hypothetical protein
MNTITMRQSQQCLRRGRPCLRWPQGLGRWLRGALLGVVATGTVALFGAFALVVRPAPAATEPVVVELPRVVITGQRLPPEAPRGLE